MRSPKIRWVILAVTLTLGFGFLTGPAMGADGIDPDADKILQSMSTYLGGTKAFSMNADVDFEIVGLNGQKLQLSSLVTVVMERPAKFHIARKGLIADAEFIFDGETLSLLGKNSMSMPRYKCQEPLTTQSGHMNLRPVFLRRALISCLPIPMPFSLQVLRAASMSVPRM